MQLSEKHPEELREDVLEHLRTDLKYGPARARKRLTAVGDMQTVLEDQESGEEEYEGRVPCEDSVESWALFLQCFFVE